MLVLVVPVLSVAVLANEIDFSIIFRARLSSTIKLNPHASQHRHDPMYFGFHGLMVDGSCSHYGWIRLQAPSPRDRTRLQAEHRRRATEDEHES